MAAPDDKKTDDRDGKAAAGETEPSNQGVSTPEPAEGGDDKPGGGSGSPEG